MRHLPQITRLIREVTCFLLALKGLVAVLVLLADKCANWGEVCLRTITLSSCTETNTYLFQTTKQIDVEK